MARVRARVWVRQASSAYRRPSSSSSLGTWLGIGLGTGLGIRLGIRLGIGLELRCRTRVGLGFGFEQRAYEGALVIRGLLHQFQFQAGNLVRVRVSGLGVRGQAQGQAYGQG